MSYPCDVKADTKRYEVRTVIVVMARVSTDLDCALSYAPQRLGTPNLILKPEQQSVIESICNGKDTFVWLPTGFGLPVDLLSRRHFCCSPALLNNATLFCCLARTDTKSRQTLRYVRTDPVSVVQ